MQITRKKKNVSALKKVFSQIENFRFSAQSSEKVVSKQNSSQDYHHDTKVVSQKFKM